MVAPSGARKQKSDHPMVPVTIPEIAQTAYDCFHAGADSLHLHVRTKSGKHSLDPVIYKEALHAVAEKVPDMPVQITTESAGLFDVATQLHCIKSVTPEAVSISIREMTRDISLAKNIYGFCAEAGIAVQHILYDTNDITVLREWYVKTWIPSGMTSVIYVLGQYQPEIPARPENLNCFIAAANGLHLDWTICAFGQHELACAKTALQMGGNIRIGFENNILLPDGSPAKSNPQIVALAANLIKDMTHD